METNLTPPNESWNQMNVVPLGFEQKPRPWWQATSTAFAYARRIPVQCCLVVICCCGAFLCAMLAFRITAWLYTRFLMNPL